MAPHLAEPLRDEASRKELVDQFLAADASARFVFGTGTYSRRAAGLLPVAGFIDDYRGGETVDGIPVFAGNQVPSASWALNGSSDHPRSVSLRMRELGLQEVDYLSMRRFTALGLPYPMFGTSPRGEIKTHQEWYAEFFHLLADDESRLVLRAVLSARWHEDLMFLADYRSRPAEQYFEPFLGLRPDGEHFVDVGSFDGATSLGFAERAPGYSRITAFEPHPGLAVGVRRALSGLRDVDTHDVGAGDEPGTLRFRSAGSASALADDGDLEVRIERLDDLVRGAPTFIKMDIEGAEVAALRGASGLIRDHRPILAICAYHRVDDLRTIPMMVAGLDGGYRFYLRHYTEGIAETVLFAVPSDRAG